MPINDDAWIERLAESTSWQERCKAAITKKAIAVLDDVRTNGNTNYTVAQATKAQSIADGANLQQYYADIAASTNVVASTVDYDPKTGTVSSDISDAALESQIWTTVWLDMN